MASRNARADSDHWPGGGVAIITRTSSTLETLKRHNLGGIWAKITPEGKNPFHLIGLYVPTSTCYILRERPHAREELLEWASRCIERIEASNSPTVIVGGDMNVALGGIGGRRAEVRQTKSTYATFLSGWVRQHHLKPTHGTLHREKAEHTTTGVGGKGMGEPDYIFVGPALEYITIKETQVPTHAVHRPRTICATIPPPQTPVEEAPRGPPRLYIRPPYNDSTWRDPYSKDTDAWLRREKDTLLDPATTPSAMLDTINTRFMETLTNSFHQEPFFGKSKVERNYKGGEIPLRAANLLALARNFKHRASRVASSGDSAKALRLRQQAHQNQKLAAQIIMDERSRTMHKATSRLLKTDSSGFYKILESATSDLRSPDHVHIPPSDDGPAEDTFPALARQLFTETRNSVPATVPGSTEATFWDQFIPRVRESQSIPAATFGGRVTIAEAYNTIFGYTTHFPPVPCNAACSLCVTDAAHFIAHKAGLAGRPGAPLAGSKAPGPDDICAEAMSWLRDCEHNNGSTPSSPTESTRVLLADVIADFFNKLLDSGEVPDALTSSKVIALLKPRKDKIPPDATAFASYRLLSLRNLLDKVVQLIITRRLSHFMNLFGLLPPEQTGFMNHLSTEDALFIALHSTRRTAAVNSPIYNVFMDIRRAYDEVHHQSLLHILRKMGVPSNLVRLIGGLLATASGQTVINGKTSESFPQTKGLGQGGPLSPLLWNIYATPLSAFLRSDDSTGIRILQTRLHMLLYADDGFSSNNTRPRAETLLAKTKRWADAWGLELNINVGKTMFTYHDGGHNAGDQPPLQVDALGQVLFTVYYPYLGLDFDNALTLEKSMQERRDKLWHAFRRRMHSNSIIRGLPMAQQFQVLKNFMGQYASAFAPINYDNAAFAFGWGSIRVNQIRDVLQVPKFAGTSILLLYTISGIPTERAHRLKERVRVQLHFECHPHLRRTDPEGNPIQCGTSVALYRDLADEAAARGNNVPLPSLPPPPYNFISETNAAMRKYNYLHTRDSHGTLIQPQYPFEIHPITKNLEQAISYKDCKDHCHLKLPLWRARTGIFDAAPECDGMEKHCGFVTAWLTAPDDEFTRQRGAGLGTLGPSLRHPLTYASAGRWRTLVDAYRGAAALRLPPWAPEPPPTASTTADADEDPAPYANWSTYTPCPLCHHPQDSIYHAACECQHINMLYMRRDLRASTGKHIDHLTRSLNTARLRTLARPPAPQISPTEKEAIKQAGNSLVDIRSPHSELEARIYIYRLLIAAPWAARNAMEGHHIAKGIGKLFDSIPARYTDNNLIREAGNLMCNWGDRWLNRIARIRRQSIDAEQHANPTA